MGDINGIWAASTRDIHVQLSPIRHSEVRNKDGEREDPLEDFHRVYQAARAGTVSRLNLDKECPSGPEVGPQTSGFDFGAERDGPLNFDDDELLDMDDAASGGGRDAMDGEDGLPAPAAEDEELQFNGGVIRVRQARIRAPLVKRAIAQILSSSEVSSIFLIALAWLAALPSPRLKGNE